MDIDIVGTVKMAEGIATRALAGGRPVVPHGTTRPEALGYLHLHMYLQDSLGTGFGSTVKFLPAG
ncbi:MAG: hypothetical protein QM729_03110 [Solirubrobacterales bacterium]